MPKIEVTSDALAIAADRGYLPNVTDVMWSAVCRSASAGARPGGLSRSVLRDCYPGDRPVHLAAG